MTVRTLIETLGSNELDLWWAFYEEQPWATPELSAGLISSCVYNAAGAKPATKPGDFMPKIPKQQTAEEIERIFRAITGLPST